MPGVQKAVVSFETTKALIIYDQGRTSLSQLLKAIEARGFRAGAATLALRVQGSYCAGCIPQIEEALKRTPGVLAAALNPATEEVHVDHIPSLTYL